jgi:O-antigen/teichoic acid export membrane protein
VTIGLSPLAPDGAAAAARRAAWTIGVRVTAVAVLGASSILTARGLNPAGRGTYGLVIALSWIATAVGHLSIQQAIVLRWQRGDDRQAIASTSFFIGLLSGVAAAAAGWVAIAYLGIASLSTYDRRLVMLALPTVPLNILASYLGGLHVLAGRLTRMNWVRLIVAFAQLAVLGALWARGSLDVTSAVVVWVVTLSAGPVLLLIPGLSIRLGFSSRVVAASLLRTGLKYHVGMAALFLLRRVDTVLLAALATRREVGLYVVAVVLAELVFLPGESITQVILPRQVVGSLEDAAAYTARVVRVNALVGVGTALALAAASPFVVRIAYGHSYVGSVPLLLAILPGVVAVGLTRPITPILVRLDRPFVVSLICVAALMLNVALNLALIPILGALGASIASSVAYAAQAYAYTFWLLRSTSLRLSDLRPTRRDLELFEVLIRRAPIQTASAP